jgi:hypothetical protein
MPNRKLPPNEDVIKMYEAGMSSGEIAEKCGVAPVTVSSLFWRIGYPMRSASEAALICEAKGRKPPTRYWLGKKQPREMVEKRLSKIRGCNHYMWKGGKDNRDYREAIEKTICAECSAHINLCIHHIDFDHYNNKPDNLQVLCVSCHMSLHKSAYWDAIHSGETPPKSNGPVGWNRD